MSASSIGVGSPSARNMLDALHRRDAQLDELRRALQRLARLDREQVAGRLGLAEQRDQPLEVGAERRAVAGTGPATTPGRSSRGARCARRSDRRRSPLRSPQTFNESFRSHGSPWPCQWPVIIPIFSAPLLRSLVERTRCDGRSSAACSLQTPSPMTRTQRAKPLPRGEIGGHVRVVVARPARPVLVDALLQRLVVVGVPATVRALLVEGRLADVDVELCFGPPPARRRRSACGRT